MLYANFWPYWLLTSQNSIHLSHRDMLPWTCPVNAGTSKPNQILKSTNRCSPCILRIEVPSQGGDRKVGSLRVWSFWFCKMLALEVGSSCILIWTVGNRMEGCMRVPNTYVSIAFRICPPLKKVILWRYAHHCQRRCLPTSKLFLGVLKSTSHSNTLLQLRLIHALNFAPRESL